MPQQTSPLQALSCRRGKSHLWQTNEPGGIPKTHFKKERIAIDRDVGFALAEGF